MDDSLNRRPLASRSRGWARWLARACADAGGSPNAVSVLGLAAAGAGAGGFVLAAHNPLWWLAGAAGIQMRLLANLIDGMVAVEWGRKTPTGPLFNEAPDRLADSVLLIAAGYAAGVPMLGWAAALLAMGTAYLRALGGSLGLAQDYCGPMAKQHRMAVLTAGAVIAALAGASTAIVIALWLIVAGSALTCLRRVLRLAAGLREA